MAASPVKLAVRLLAGCCLGLTLTACTVESGSKIGLSVSPDGHVLAVVAVCKGYLDGVTVYSGSGSKDHDDGRWRHTGRLASDATLDLQLPGEGWSTERALTLGTPGRHSIYGWTKANRWSADGLDFQPPDVQKLRTGDVWFEQAHGTGFRMTFVPMASFHETVCRDYK